MDRKTGLCAGVLGLSVTTDHQRTASVKDPQGETWGRKVNTALQLS